MNSPRMADLGVDEKVLKIGTGSSYQAAILSQPASQVYTLEIRDSLGEEAAAIE